MRALAFLLLALGPLTTLAKSQVLLQGFWWDFWNNNFPSQWADYLAELSPRYTTVYCVYKDV